MHSVALTMAEYDPGLHDGHFETVLPIDPEDAPFVVNIETPLGFERTLVERADQE